MFASREMAVAAGQLPDPTLKAGIENLPVNGADAFSLTRDFMTMRRIGVMQEFTREEKRQLRAERFEREAERSLAEKSATLATIQRDTALAWLDRYYAEAMAGVIAEQIKAARLEIEAAETAYRGGRGNQADIFAARSSVVSLEDRASEIGRRIRTAKTALARWIGESAETAARRQTEYRFRRAGLARAGQPTCASSADRDAHQAGRDRRHRGEAGAGEQEAGLEPGADVQPARPRVTRTWFRSAWRSHCSGTRRTARTARLAAKLAMAEQARRSATTRFGRMSPKCAA